MRRHATVALLLMVSLISRSVCRPSMKQLSARVVDTVGGQLRAVVISRPGLRPVEAFLGLRYATAERFRRPTTSVDRWQGVRVARNFGPVCPQPIPDIDQLTRTLPRGRLQYFRRLLTFVNNQSEDCLNLNLYAPLIYTGIAWRARKMRIYTRSQMHRRAPLFTSSVRLFG